jgi:endonuclease YncB( thermonuclease family)
MSMHWNPGKPPVGIKGSKIRRTPAQASRIRRAPPPVAKKVVARTDTEETWFGVAGVLAVAAALVAVIVGVSYFTFFKTDPAAAAPSFGQCYNSQASNCVVDGGTAFVAGEEVQIAGMVAPAIRDAQCDAERSLGISAAMRLAALLNSGPVTVGAPFQDELGRTVQLVRAKGKDVGAALIDEKLALRVGRKKNFC